jgi:hypothetical protein
MDKIELHYYHTQEDTEYTTWIYDKGNVYINPWHMGKGAKLIYVKEEEENYQGIVGGYDNGWVKQTMPNNLTKAGQLEWYIISNKEDLHFIMKESEACAEWMMKHMDDILKAQKENKKIKQYNLVV